VYRSGLPSQHSNAATSGRWREAQESRHQSYAFIPVSMTPWMKYFWAKKKMTMTGVVMMRLGAIMEGSSRDIAVVFGPVTGRHWGTQRPPI